MLIVGLGSIGRRHARLARELLPGARIIALRHLGCGDDPGVEIDACVTTVAEALRHEPQLAVVANPATHHVDVACTLARAGVHLLVEKPLASDSGPASELVELCEAMGVMLMVGYNLRFLPTLQHFRSLLGKGTVGRVLSVRAEIGQYLPLWRPGTDYRRSVSAQAALGGGVLLELSHEVDYLRWVFGEVGWVMADERRQGDLEIDVSDVAHIILGFEAPPARGPVASLCMDFIRRDTTRTCTAVGEQGTLRWDALAGTVELFNGESAAWQRLLTDPPARDQSYLAEWRHFLACVADGTRPLVSGRDGLATLRVIDAVRESSLRGARTQVVAGTAPRQTEGE